MNVLAFFTNSGIPAVGLSPTIKIRDVLTGALTISGANMTETGDGFYYYSFAGYEYETDYAIVCDGTDILPDAERYVFAGNENYINDIGNVFDTNTTLSGIQEDLNNPDQYKANISGLALETTVSGVKERTDNLPNLPAPKNEYDVRMLAIQSDLDTHDQYKADITGLVTETTISGIKERTDRIPNSPSFVDEYGTVLSGIQGDLNNPDQYKADISGLALTGEYDVTLSGIQSDLDDPDQYKATGFTIPADIPTISEIDTEFTNSHGAGSWTTGSGLNEQGLHDGLDAYINKDCWKATGFSVSGEYDATLSGIQVDLDNPDQYKADISALALESTTSGIKDQTDQLHFSGDNVQSKVADKGVLNDLSAADVDNQLSSVHGSGDWDQVATVSGLETKLDIIQTDLDNPDQYKADVSGLALETTVSGIEIGLLRVLGLVQENYHLDQMTYTVYQETSLLTSGRVRVYSDAASVGTDSNVLAVYDITASYDGDKLQTYKVVKQ